MMKLLAYVLVPLAFCGPINAQQHGAHNAPAAKKATLMTGLGDLHHPVSTTNAEAQKFFDQGLRLILIPNWRWHTGASRKPLAQTTMTPLIQTASNRRMKPLPKPVNWQPAH